MAVVESAVEPGLQTDFHGLYSDHHSWLQGVLRRHLGCATTAEDLCHDVFVRLLGKPDLPEFQEPRAYLARVARRLVVDRHRRQVVEQAYLEALAQQPELVVPSVEETNLVLETLVSIDAMLGGLKPKVRETFLLSRFDGLTYRAIASKLDISVATVRKYMLIAMEACVAATADAEK